MENNNMSMEMKRYLTKKFVETFEKEYMNIYNKHEVSDSYINHLFVDILKQKKYQEWIFDIIRLPKYFTIWDGYLETPISWDIITGDRWIGNVQDEDNEDYNIYNWLIDNEDYLWDIFQYHLLDNL